MDPEILLGIKNQKAADAGFLNWEDFMDDKGLSPTDEALIDEVVLEYANSINAGDSPAEE